MSTRSSWKSTPYGQVAMYIGGVKFAVPALTLAAIAMIWGTWIDSTVGRDIAFERVYGAFWFVALMALICASLILSVAVRYPWRKKHIGFIIVHASLVSLIAIGFYTMRTKIEGRIILQEGSQERSMQLDKQWLQVVEHTSDGGWAPKAAEVVTAAGEIALRDNTRAEVARVTITDIWENCEEVLRVLNDSPEPMRAIEIVTDPAQTTGDWVPQIEAGEPAFAFGAFALRVVPTGQSWAAPTGSAELVILDSAKQQQTLPAPGEKLGGTAWTVTEVVRFERATIGRDGEITERPTGQANPAARVLLTHEDGSVERQIVFQRFREQPFVGQVSGATASGWQLTYVGESLTEPTLAVLRDGEGRTSAIFASPDGEPVAYEHDGVWPWNIVVGGKPLSILQDFDRARGSTELQERPASGDSNSPAVVVEAGGARAICRWNSPTPLEVGGKPLMLQYGPVRIELPFTMKLEDFRKMDYPGSEMAMAYESDVQVTPDNGAPQAFKIHMNHPYKQDGWKVYQSGFLGEDVTVLQVTRDPGLVPMYLACTSLCIGILVTFYSRSLSWGHPDIPVPFPQSVEGESPANSGHQH
ncbi:MAG: cytochrome c biogenesis protein ResB [Phycisphaerales bacterium]|nr:cytochrome c biogenesis protein ResB [Phycisphaerales bacterium]